MFIRELQVDGYSALNGVKLGFETPVTVIYGPNEAGKSTLLRFVRSMLYGFPTRKDPVERGEPVNGGRHGGRMILSVSSDVQWVLERYAERGSGFTVRDTGGLDRHMQQPEWEKLALGGVSERLFRQLFAVSLDELHELRSLQGEEIGNYLYHAGMAGGAALTAARRQIGGELDKLFRPKGTTQEINRLLSAIKETEASLRLGRDSIIHFNETNEALDRLEQELAELEPELPELRMHTAELQGTYDLREWWLKGQALLMEEAELRKVLANPAAPLLAEEARALWIGLKEKRREAADNAEKARKTELELTISREALTWDEGLVRLLPELERLESLREGIVARREEGSELESERRMLDESINGMLARLSHDWSEDDLQGFGGLAAERDQVRRLQQHWEEAERAAESLHADIRRITRQQHALQAESDSEHRQGGEPLFKKESPTITFIPRTRAALLQTWHELEDAVRQYERARTEALLNLPARIQRQSKPPAGIMYGIAGIAAITAAALPFLLSQDNGLTPSYLTLIVVLLIAAAGIFLFTFRRRSRSAAVHSSDKDVSLRVHRRQVADRLSRLLQDSEAAASLLPEPSEDSMKTAQVEDTYWQELRNAVYQEIEQLDKENQQQVKRFEAESRLQELSREKSVIEKELIELNDRLSGLQAEWQNWLSARKLPLHLTPESLPELLSLAEQGQVTLRQRQRIIERLAGIRSAIDQFQKAAAIVIEQCPPPASFGHDAVTAVHGLYREALRHQTAKEEASRVDRLLSAAMSEAERAGEQLSRIQHAIEAFLADVQAADDTELEQRLRIDEQCRDLQKQLREIQLRLESGRDAIAVQKLYDRFEGNDEAALRALLEEQQTKLASVEQQRTELLDRRGRLAQELQRLRSESELEDRAMRLSELQSKLEALLERYAILAITDTLITRTKSVFEEEKQPEVLRLASRYLEQMTDGAYIRIVAPGDRPALLAETKERRLLDSAFLSRGTQEQLFLAMRFALCDAASREQPLPLLLDDLFVHFDEKRLVNTIPVLQQLAAKRQVILFTCHRHVARSVTAAIPTARTLMLGEPGAEAHPADAPGHG